MFIGVTFFVIAVGFLLLIDSRRLFAGIEHDEYSRFGDAIIMSMSTSARAQNIPAREMDALEDLYTSTHGIYWLWRENNETLVVNHYAHWNFTGYHNPCAEKWQGILCSCENVTDFSTAIAPNVPFPIFPFANISTTTNCSIIAIILVAFNLTGELPSSLGNLTSLQLISFSLNTLYGAIPPSLGRITGLQLLQLDFNKLSGVIPLELYSLSEMKYLYLER